MVRWFVLIVALYIAADIASPQIPGAMVFDPASSVEARQSGSFWAIDDVMPSAPVRAHALGVTLVDRPARPVLRAWSRPAAPIHHARPLLRPPRSVDDDTAHPARAALT